MNWADWTIVAILVLSALISVKRGFVKEALSLATWVAAILVAMIFAGRLAILLEEHIDTPSLRELVAFTLLFVGTLLVGSLVNYLVGTLVKVTGLSGTDRLLGMCFGLARGVVIVMALLIFLPALLSVQEDSWWQQSQLIPGFLEFESRARELGSDTLNFFKGLLS